MDPDENEEEETGPKEATMSGRLKARQRADARQQQQQAEDEAEAAEDSSGGLSSRQRTADDYLPDSMRAKTAPEIDILLVETDTIWMLELPGTCIEFDPDKKQEDGEDDKRDEGGDNKRKVENPSVSR